MDAKLANELPGIIVRLAFYLILVVAIMIPSWRILRRTGLSPWWSLLAFVPVGFVVVLWLIAYRRWPKGT